MSKHTKKQTKHDKELSNLEFLFDNILLKLKDLNDNKKYLKMHASAVLELHYMLNSIKERLWPDDKPLQW